MRLSRQALVWGCVGWFSTCQYYDLHSNALPLAFGMTPDAAATALNVPLVRVSGGRNSEILYAQRPTTMPSFFRYDRQLWLQFRNGRLTGWKNDWTRSSWW